MKVKDLLAHGDMGEGINPVFMLFGAIAIMEFCLARVLRQESNAGRSKPESAASDEVGAGQGKEAPTAR